MAKTDIYRIVVVGAGFAGLAVVKALPEDARISITLVDRRNHHLFQALLYQVATAGLNPSEIASPVRALFRNRKNVRVLLGELTELDQERSEAILDGGGTRLPYDSLVLAIGGQTSYFGNDHWRDHSFPLKSIEEALAIRQRVLLAFEEAEKSTDAVLQRQLMTIVVIGGGPTGVELSGAFAELRSHVLRWDFRNIDPGDARIVLLEGGPRVLSSFPPELSSAAQCDLEALGVEVRTSEHVLEIAQGQVVTTQGVLEAHTVVWAGGICGQSFVKDFGFPLNERSQVRVDAYHRTLTNERIFCLGDMSTFTDSLTGTALPAMAPVAMQQGRHCGLNLVRQWDGEPLTPFEYADPGIMATVGRTRGVALLNGRMTTGARGWLTWLTHHLLRIVDFQNRVLVAARWAWAYLGWKWGVRLVYGDRISNGSANPVSPSEGTNT